MKLTRRPNYNPQIIGLNLKRMRIENEFTAEELSKLLNYSCVQTIYKWERGESLPTADVFLKLLSIYQITDIRELLRE